MSIGLVGKKVGMTRVFSEDGVSTPVTVIEVTPNRISQVRAPETDGYSGMQVTVGERRANRVTKPMKGHFAKAGVEPGRGVWEFRLQEPAENAVGSELTVDVFSVGQKVDVSGRTNQSNTLSGGLNASYGNFWNGTRTTYGGSLTWKTGPNLTLTGSASRNDVDLPVEDGQFSTTLTSLGVLAAVSRDLFANALVQWDNVSKTLRANVRINWIHTPGSDLFLVFDTGYLTEDPLDPRESRWLQRTGVVKLTYVWAL